MKKLTVTVCGRSYAIRTDDTMEKMKELIKELEKKCKDLSVSLKSLSELDVMTLVALDILDSSKHEIQLLKSQLESATSEMAQIANFKDTENEQLRSKLQDYEKSFEAYAKERDDEIVMLRKSYESAKSEMEHIAEEQEKEYQESVAKQMEYEKNISEASEKNLEEVNSKQISLEDVKNELEHMASVQEDENESKLQSFLNFEQSMAAQEAASDDSKLNDFRKEFEQIATEEAGQNDKLRLTLNTYEKTFDDYIKQKDEEIRVLVDELNEYKAKEKAATKKGSRKNA